MVSLESKFDYLLSVSDNPKLYSFYCLISRKKIPFIPNDLREIDRLYFGLLTSFGENNQQSFNTYYSQISKRKIDDQSTAPFIHDDGLIFILLLGIRKFDYGTTWIQQILNVRQANEVTNTFKSITNGDYFNRSNLCSIIIPFVDLLGGITFQPEFLTESYNTISSSIQLFKNKNDFLIIMSLRAYDIIIQTRAPSDFNVQNLKRFETIFQKRSRQIARVIYNVILFLIVYSIWKLLSIHPSIREKVNDLGSILGILGLQIVGNFFSSLLKFTEKKIQKFFGYS